MEINHEALTEIFTASLTHSEGAGSDSLSTDIMYDGSIEFNGYIDVAQLVSDVQWYLDNGTNPYV